MKDETRLCSSVLRAHRGRPVPHLHRPGAQRRRDLRGRGAGRSTRGRARRASSAAATTSCTARSRRSTASVRTSSRSSRSWCGCGTRRVREVILATNPTAEGEATALYLARAAQAARPAGHPHRARAAGRRRPRVRRRDDRRTRARGPARDVTRATECLHGSGPFVISPAVPR